MGRGYHAPGPYMTLTVTQWVGSLSLLHFIDENIEAWRIFIACQGVHGSHVIGYSLHNRHDWIQSLLIQTSFRSRPPSALESVLPSGASLQPLETVLSYLLHQGRVLSSLNQGYLMSTLSRIYLFLSLRC